MITAFQFASLPFWVLGFFFVGIAFPVGAGWGKRPGETTADLGSQMVSGIIIGLVLLVLAAIMWRY